MDHDQRVNRGSRQVIGMAHRYLRHILLGCFLVIVFPALVLANGPANVYKVTITKFEMFNGSDWVTIFDGTSTTIDIAAATSGAAAGSFLAGQNIPDGTYTQVRATPSATFSVKGNDGSRYTTATKGPNGGCVYSSSAAAEAECSVTISDGVTATTTTLSQAITSTAGVSSHKVRVSFDTSTAIQYVIAADELFPAQPTVTISIIAL